LSAQEDEQPARGSRTKDEQSRPHGEWRDRRPLWKQERQSIGERKKEVVGFERRIRVGKSERPWVLAGPGGVAHAGEKQIKSQYFTRSSIEAENTMFNALIEAVIMGFSDEVL
jgi:hypothetical protein